LRYLNSPFFSLGHYATEGTVNLENRVEVYSNPNYEETYAVVSEYGNQLLDKIGLFSVETTMPIAANLVNLGFVGMFIGVMFKLIIFSLFLLSAIMMNNMFRVGVERKGFDFALLKVMGADRLFIITNILAGSLKFVALANIIAYPLAYFALQYITLVFQDFFGYRHEITPTGDAVLGGIFIGVLVPIISSIAPIWGVIRNDLA
jgi:ABC-type antimicrobial peptide transport system permease subunit